MHPAHQIAFRCLHQKMIMITHQHLSVHSPTVALTDLAEGREEDFAILVIPENRLPSITAAGADDKARHRILSAAFSPSNNNRHLTPPD